MPLFKTQAGDAGFQQHATVTPRCSPVPLGACHVVSHGVRGMLLLACMGLLGCSSLHDVDYRWCGDASTTHAVEAKISQPVEARE